MTIVDAERYRIAPDQPPRLHELDPEDISGFNGPKKIGQRRHLELNARLEELQELLYAEGKHSLLVVLQAMDTGGKDGTIRNVFDGTNPQGVVVASFKAPTEEERAHDFLWRVHRHTPKRGNISVFNRSHYEDVLVVRVKDLMPEARWRDRYRHIREFERMLAEEGTTIRKFFLHISKEEQRERLQSRLDNPRKHWKFSKGDLEERKRWPQYQTAFEEMIAETSTEYAPWYVIPANRKWYRNLIVSQILVSTLEGLGMSYPQAPPGLDGITIDG